MAGEEGGRRAEWIGADSVACWVFWRRPEEWAEVVAAWVSLRIPFWGGGEGGLFWKGDVEIGVKMC